MASHHGIICTQPIKHDQFFWVLHRKLAKKQRVYDAEHRRVRADAERERCDCGRRKARASAEGAKRISEVAAQLIQQPEPETLPSLFLVFLHGSKFEPRDPPGLFPG